MGHVAVFDLWRDLGTFRLLGLHVFMGGILLSVIAYPLFSLALAWKIVSGHLFDAPESELGTWFWALSAINLVLGFTASILVGIVAAAQRGRWWLAPRALLMPFYWFAISFAGYRAMWQLVRQPFLWEKTRHGRQ